MHCDLQGSTGYEQGRLLSDTGVRVYESGVNEHSKKEREYRLKAPKGGAFIALAEGHLDELGKQH